MILLPAPIISRDVPAYTNDDFSGAFPAALANNSAYSNRWRCLTEPAGGADSGTLTMPVWLAYDLSGVTIPLGQCLVAIYNDPVTGAYDYNLVSAIPDNVPANYTIEANAAAGGGSAPESGWDVLITVSNSPYHSRNHLVDLTSYNWIRINVTAIFGSVSNNNCALNMDVHSLVNGNQDTYAVYGDSIGLQAFLHSDTTVPAQINAIKPSNFPMIEQCCLGGFLSTTGQANFSTWFTLQNANIIVLQYGVNDANNASPGDPNFKPDFIAAMSSMIETALAAGRTMLLPKTITWGKTTNLQANGPDINDALVQLAGTYPVIVGPDQWAFFEANQNLITDADVHPTPDGYLALQNLWVESLVANFYTNSAGNSIFYSAQHRKLRMIV